MRDAITSYLRDHSATKRSVIDDRRHARVWTEQLGDRPLDQVTRAELRALRARRLEDRSPATWNRLLAFLRHLYALAVDSGVVSVNPCARLQVREPSGRVRYLSDEEETQLMAALEPWERARVLVLLETGLRKSEFLGLRVRDIDVKANVLTIPRSKSGERRSVPLTSRVRSLLQARPRPLDARSLVFPNTEGNADLRWFEKALPRAIQAAGLVDFRPHDLRHTFASRLVMAGVDLLTVQRLGGWKTLSMVQRYAHLSPDHLHTSIEKLVTARSAVPPGMPLALPADPRPPRKPVK